MYSDIKVMEYKFVLQTHLLYNAIHHRDLDAKPAKTRVITRIWIYPCNFVQYRSIYQKWYGVQIAYRNVQIHRNTYTQQTPVNQHFNLQTTKSMPKVQIRPKWQRHTTH